MRQSSVTGPGASTLSQRPSSLTYSRAEREWAREGTFGTAAGSGGPGAGGASSALPGTRRERRRDGGHNDDDVVVRVGVTMPKRLPDDASAVADIVVEAVANIEEAGFDTIWIPDVLNRGYTTLDPLIYAATVATVSPRVRVGTAVFQVGRHNAVELAQRVLSVSLLAGGRFTLGAGAGSTPGDFDAVSVPFDERFRTLDHNLAILRALLGGSTVDGVTLIHEPPPWVTPPVVIGAWRSKWWIKRAAKEFDGWIASTAKTNLETLRDSLAIYRSHGGGRAIAGNLYVDLTVTAGSDRAAGGVDLRCSPTEASARLSMLEDAGFDEVTLTIFDHSPDHLATLRSLI